MDETEALRFALDAMRTQKAELERATGGYVDRRPLIVQFAQAIAAIETMLREMHEAYQ